MKVDYPFVRSATTIRNFVRSSIAILFLAAPLWAASAQPLTIDFGGSRPAKTVQVTSSSTWVQDSALTFYDPASSATVSFVIGEDQNPSGWTMTVLDRISMVSASRQGTVFPSFVLNGRVVPSEAIPWSELNSTSYPVGQFLRPGRNVLQITASVEESVNEYQIGSIVFGPPGP